MIKNVAAVFALLWAIMCLGGTADAQQTAKVLATCGTASYTAATTNYITIDTTGAACGSAGGGGGGSVTQGTTPWVIAPQVTSANTNAIAPVVSDAAEANHVFKGSAGNLYSAYVTTGATGGFLLVFNATSAPADGAVTPIHCVQAPANTTVGLSFGAGPPESFATGITASFSSTGCFTKTASATAFFHGSIQ